MIPFGELIVYLLKFYIPSIWSVIFRAVAFGYSSKKRLAIGFAVYTAYTFLIPGLLINLLGYGKYTHISAYVNTLGGLCVLIFTTDTVGKTIFLQLAQGGMVTAMSVVINCARTLMGFSYEILLVVLAVCSPILFFVALKLWAKPMRFLIDNIQDKVWLLLLLPILTFVLVTYLPTYPPMTFANHPVYCTLMMLAVELSFFLYLYIMYRNIRKITFLKDTEATNDLLEAEIDHYKTFCEAAKTNRHDLRHHNAILLEYLEEGDTAAAIDYLKEHEHILNDAGLEQFCAEPTVNAVLRMFDRRAKERHIDFAATASISDKLPLKKPEIGGLIGNLLENAFTAAENCGNGAPFIRLAAETDGGNFLVETKNTVFGKTEFRNGIPLSQKPGGGTGTLSMTETVKAYGGIIGFSQEDDIFTVRVLIPLNK